jgi:predicted membrane protein
MGFASHLGPWLLGTVKNTTGTTAGTIQNTGATSVTQTKKVVYTGTVAAATATTTLFTIPAGAQITSIHIDTLVAFTGSTAANVVIGTAATTNLFWASSDITAQGRLANTNAAAKLVNWAGATSTASPNGIGVGPTDVIIQAALTPTAADVTAGTVQYTIVYSVADSTGVQSPPANQQ